MQAKITILGLVAAFGIKTCPARRSPAVTLRQNFHQISTAMAEVYDSGTDDSFQEKIEAMYRSVALRTALSQRPTEVNNVFKLASGAAKANEVMWTEIAPDAEYSPCSHRNRQEGKLDSELASMWEVDNQSWPVLREGNGVVCSIQRRVSGKSDHSVPFLTLVEAYQKEACEYNPQEVSTKIPDHGLAS